MCTGTSAIPGSHSQVTAVQGGSISYGQGYQGPRDYVADSRTPAGYRRQQKRGGGGGGGVAAAQVARRLGPTSRYANRPIEVAVASGTAPIPLETFAPVLLGTSGLSSTLG